MPTGQPTFIQDAHTNVAEVTPVGHVKVNEVFDILKPSFHESMTRPVEALGSPTCRWASYMSRVSAAMV